MSGGSHSYLYARMREEYVGRMYDKELDAMMLDICKLVQDLEWYDSADYSREQYFNTVKKFKNKWFVIPREARLKELVDESLEELRQDLYELIGVKEVTP